MTAHAAQEPLTNHGPHNPTPGAVKPRRSPHRAGLRVVPPTQPTLRYTPARLTTEQATAEALEVLAEAGLRGQVSRVLTESTSHLPGCLATICLLRAGADQAAVHTALLGLPGIEGTHRGEASVSVYRAAVSQP